VVRRARDVAFIFSSGLIFSSSPPIAHAGVRGDDDAGRARNAELTNDVLVVSRGWLTNNAVVAGLVEIGKSGTHKTVRAQK
jgi:hypothetical protein